eukprot:6950812-Prymnesium_polylepis.1
MRVDLHTFDPRVLTLAFYFHSHPPRSAQLRICQVLEGPQHNVRTLYDKIAKDSRHTDCKVEKEEQRRRSRCPQPSPSTSQPSPQPTPITQGVGEQVTSRASQSEPIRANQSQSEPSAGHFSRESQSEAAHGCFLLRDPPRSTQNLVGWGADPFMAVPILLWRCRSFCGSADPFMAGDRESIRSVGHVAGRLLPGRLVATPRVSYALIGSDWL